MRSKTVAVAAALTGLAFPAALAGTANAATPSASPHWSGNQSITFRAATLEPVAHNRVHGFGFADVLLRGHTVSVDLTYAGLLRDAPHAMHIHDRGEGECPEARDAGTHNGHRAMSTADGQEDYGGIGASLTTSGDTSPASALAIDRFPSAGTYHYHRTFTVSEDVVQALREGNAVIVVHGIDYNRNGTYDNVLGASELNPALPEEATAPALCGALN
jgi:Cu/Zn superoxide dismutase